MRHVNILVAGKNQGLTHIDWRLESAVTKQLLPNADPLGFNAKLTFGLARRGKGTYHILFAPNYYRSDDLCYLALGYPPYKLSHIPKPGPAEMLARSGKPDLSGEGETFDWHGATWTDLGFFITSTRFGLAWFEYSIEIGFARFKGWFKFDYDRLWHVNAILIKDGIFHLCFHRLSEKMNVSSRVAQFIPDLENLTLTKINDYKIGRDIHDLVYVEKYGLITCSSAEARVIGVDWNYELQIEPSERVVNPYIRGLYYSAECDVLVVGKSGRSKEEQRIGNCELDFYDFGSGTLIDRVALPNAGTINQIIDYSME